MVGYDDESDIGDALAARVKGACQDGQILRGR
jgi:hypothetical protein